MVCEVIQVKRFLQGEGVSGASLFPALHMMVKYHRQEGRNETETRGLLLQWHETYSSAINGYVRFDFNRIIANIFSQTGEGSRLKSSTVYISKKDIDAVDKHAETKNEKLVALALICYAKAHSTRDGFYRPTLGALAFWIGLSRKPTEKYVNGLHDKGFIYHVDTARKFTRKKHNPKCKLNIPLQNTGEYELKDNDILALFNSIYPNKKRGYKRKKPKTDKAEQTKSNKTENRQNKTNKIK